MKFIHVSDVHLGVEPDKGKAWSAERKQNIWDSFREVVLRAGTEAVDFLLISGDLFHRQPLKRELREVNYLFGQIPKVKVVLMAGNHDYMQRSSYYCNFEWNPNVSFFQKEEVGSFDFPEENVTVYGMSYWHREIPKRIYDDIWVKDEGRINILMAHGGDERHIPFLAERVLRQGIDYLAAGHVHKGGMLAGDRAVMAGALEPTECNDLGEHGYWLGEIQKAGDTVEVKVEFCPVRKCEYRHVKLVITEETTQYGLEEQISNLASRGEDYVKYRIFLVGYKEADSKFDIEKLEGLPQIVDVTSNLKTAFNYGKILQEEADSLLGRYIGRMQKENLDIVGKKALEYGVSALLGYDL